MPKISVIMGAYNIEQYMHDAIESIINQTFSDWELIICDDGSTDNTFKILKEYEKKDSRIKVLKNDNNYGLAYSLNKCIQVSQGEYLARMDGDDISLPNRFEEQVKAMDNNPEYTVIGSDVILFDEEGDWSKSNYIEKPTLMDVFKGPAVAHPTTIMRAQTIKQIGGYNTETDKCHAEDYDLWCRLYEAGYKMMNLNSILFKYRWDKKNYYKRRKLKYLLGYVKLKCYWCHRLRIGLKGWTYCLITFVKAITPAFIKKVYHRKTLGIK